MGYIAMAMLGAIFGFAVAASMCAAGRADQEAEMYRIYETLKQYKEIERDHKNNQ